jgi:hypothetical protein
MLAHYGHEATPAVRVTRVSVEAGATLDRKDAGMAHFLLL